MTAILQFLQQRNSAPKLTSPGPSASQMEEVFRAAMRAPDHAWMRPWRFITIEGDRRLAFGEVLEEALLARTPDADQRGARERPSCQSQRCNPLLHGCRVALAQKQRYALRDYHGSRRKSAGFRNLYDLGYVG